MLIIYIYIYIYIYISEMATAGTKMWIMTFYVGQDLPSNGFSANVLHEIDLNFQAQTF